VHIYSKILWIVLMSSTNGTNSCASSSSMLANSINARCAIVLAPNQTGPNYYTCTTNYNISTTQLNDYNTELVMHTHPYCGNKINVHI